MIYNVEMVLGRRMQEGRTYSVYHNNNAQLVYLLKWKEEQFTYYTWEPMENIGRPDMIAEYDAAHPADAEGNLLVPGFDRGLVADKILGASDHTGELLFLMRWQEDDDDLELVPAARANIECPQVVIRFYESILEWTPCEDVNQQPDA